MGKRDFQVATTHGSAVRGGKRPNSDAGAPVPALRSPHARRTRRLGRFDHTPVTKAHSKRPLQLLLLLRPIRATIRSSADVCLKLLALVGYCALHVCADAQGRTTDCAAVAAAAPSKTAVPARPIPTTSDARFAATIAAASMSSETVRDAGHAPALSQDEVDGKICRRGRRQARQRCTPALGRLVLSAAIERRLRPRSPIGIHDPRRPPQGACRGRADGPSRETSGRRRGPRQTSGYPFVKGRTRNTLGKSSRGLIENPTRCPGSEHHGACKILPELASVGCGIPSVVMESICPLFIWMRRALLAFGSESASEGTPRTRAAHRGYIVAA